MTLSDMADHICTKVRKTDDDSIAACKKFLEQRDELIYNENLWRDSLYAFDITLPVTGTETEPNVTETAAIGMLFLPPVVDRVLGVRTTSKELYPESEELLYRSSLDEYSQTGDPVKYVVMPGAVAHWPAGGQWSLVCSDLTDTGQLCQVDYIDTTHKPRTEEFSLSSSLNYLTNQALEITRVTKPTTNGVVTLYYPDVTLTIAVQAADTSFDSRKRVRIIPAPTSATSFKVLCKRKHMRLNTTRDEPAIRNSEQALLAFGEADMLRRERQHGKANLVFQEARLLMDQLRRVETVQEAQNMRLVPEDSYEYWYDPQNKGWW